MIKYLLVGLILASPLYLLHEGVGIGVGLAVGLGLYVKAICPHCHAEAGLFPSVCRHCGRDVKTGAVRTSPHD